MTPAQHRRAASANTVDASFAEVTEAPKSEVTTSSRRQQQLSPKLRVAEEAMATTIRVNTKSGGAEGAKAALLSYYTQSLQPEFRSGAREYHRGWVVLGGDASLRRGLFAAFLLL